MNQAIQALKSENKMTDELLHRLWKIQLPSVHLIWDNGREYVKGLYDFEEATELIHWNRIEPKEYAESLMETGHKSIHTIFEHVTGCENDGSQEDADLLQETLVAFIENKLKGMGR